MDYVDYVDYYVDYLAEFAEYRGAQDDGMRNEDDPHQQQPVHTIVLQFLPPWPHNLLGLAVTKNLRKLFDETLELLYIFVKITLVIKSEPSAAAMLMQWHY